MRRNDTKCRCVPTIAPGFTFNNKVPAETAAQLGYEVTIKPTNGLTISPYEFVIEPLIDAYLVLNSFTLNMSMKIVRGAQEAELTDLDRVAPINNILQSMWRKVQVRINDHELTPETSTHLGYKGIVSTLLSYKDEVAPQLFAQGWTGETKHIASFAVAGNNVNTSHLARIARHVKSTVVDYSGPLPLDLFSADNHLAPGTKLTLSLYPEDHTFALFANVPNRDFRIKIPDLSVQYRTLTLPSPTTQKLLSSPLPHRYIAPYTLTKFVQVPANMTTYTVPVFPPDHPLPKQIIVGQVTMTAGRAYTSNPFAFRHNSVEYVAPRIDDVVPPHMAAQPHFANLLLAREYYRLFAETGKRHSTTERVLISPEQFVNGHTLFPFDLTPDKCNGRHLHAGTRSKLDVLMRWSTKLTTSINVMVLCIFDQVIAIDRYTGKPTSHII